MDPSIPTQRITGQTNVSTEPRTLHTDAQANLRWELAYEAATGRLDTQKIKNNSTSAILADFNLGYDLAGNVTSKASTVFANASNTTWSYDYDGGSRLLQAQGENATGAATTWDYLYDGGGNRTGATETTGSVVSNWTTTYDASGLATAATNAVGGETITYTYDAAGVTQLTANSTINANDWGYTYDAYSRLTCARLGSTTCGTTAAANRVAYTLDAFNRTYQRTLNTTATSYVWRGIGEDPASSTTSGTTTTYAYTAGGSPLAQKVGTAAASYYLRDPHGDTVGVVSATAAEQGTTAFDAYGKPLATSGTQALFGYQSDMTDALTKQVDMGTRWYAPGQGRFTTRDVLFGDPLHPISLNQWVYGASNPVTMWDPTGMRPLCEFCEHEENKGHADYVNCAKNGGSDCGSVWENSPDVQPAPVPPEPPVPDPCHARCLDFFDVHLGGDFDPTTFGPGWNECMTSGYQDIELCSRHLRFWNELEATQNALDEERRAPVKPGAFAVWVTEHVDDAGFCLAGAIEGGSAGALVGAGVGTVVPGVGTGIGAAVFGAGGVVAGCIAGMNSLGPGPFHH